jgi:Tfp pilus assembly protein PilF
VLIAVVVLLLTAAAIGGYRGWQAWRARGEWQAADRALAQRRLNDAQTHLDVYLASRPDSAPGHFLAARTAWRLGDYDRAQEHLTRCQQLGGDPEVLKRERLLVRAHQGNIPPETEVTLVPLARKDQNHPDAPIIFEALARGYLRSHRMIPARQCLDAWIEREPDNPEALAWRAWLRGTRGDREGALDDYRRAIEADPDNDQVRLRVCELQLQLGQPDQAAVHLNRLREHHADQPAVLLAWESYCRGQGNREESLRALDLLLADPRFSELLQYRLQGESRWPAAVSPATQAWVQQDWSLAPPEGRNSNHLAQLYVTALNCRAQLALGRNQLDAVPAWLGQALAISPSDVQAHFLFATYWEKRGERRQAEEHRATWQALLNKQKRLDAVGQELASSPWVSGLRCEAAQLLLELGQEGEGLLWLERVVREDPGFTPPDATLRELRRYYGRSKDPAARGLLDAFRTAP